MKKLIYTMIFSLCITAGCQKKPSPGPGSVVIAPSDLKITGVYIKKSSGDQQYRITYNDNNNIDSMIVTNVSDNSFRVYKYIYNTDGYKIVSSYSIPISPYTIFDTIYILTNSSGLITKINDVQNTNYYTFDYGNGYKLISFTDHFASSSYATKYYWSKNGDIDSSSSWFSYAYITNQQSQTGDGMRIEQFLKYGRSFMLPEHLLSGMTGLSGQLTATYSYNFDGNGRIIQMNMTNRQPGHATTISIDSAQYNYTY